ILVVARRRGDGDVHATDLIDLIVLNLGENDLLLDAQAVVAAAVGGTGADAAKVPDARNSDAHETIEELVHPVAAQGHLAADRLPIADLERGHRLLRLGHRGLLPRDLGHVGGRGVHDLLVGHGLAHAHVDRDLEDARDLHRVLEPKLRLELRHELLAVNRLQSCCHCGYSLTGRTYLASTISLFDLNTRTLRPFSSALKTMRSPFCVAGLKTSTFDTCSGASRSMMPPCTPICGFGRWCFLDILSPSTRTRSSASTSRTAPLRPLSRPAINTTMSPLRIFFITAPRVRAI